MSKTAKDFEDEYLKDIVFRVKTAEDEADLFELLYKHNVEYKPVPQERDTYELNLDNWCD